MGVRSLRKMFKHYVEVVMLANQHITNLSKEDKMQWFLDAIEWLKGKKTYFFSIGTILTVIGTYLSGDITFIMMAQAIWAAIMAMLVRAGISKSKSS